MKVLINQETDWLKRYSGQQHHLAEILSLRGHEVRVIDYELLWKTQGKRELSSRREIFHNVSKIYPAAGVTVIRPGIIKFPFLDYVSLIFSHRREIDRQIREFSPDVIVGFGILNSYLAARATRKSAVPFIYYWVDVLHTLIPFKPFQSIGKMVERAALKQSDTVLANCRALKDYVVEMGGPAERTYEVSEGIDLEQFDPGTSGKEVREQYGIRKDALVLFFMGWLYRFSGLKEVALELAHRGDHNLTLLVVGQGDLYEELQQIRKRHSLQQRLVLAGEQPYHEIPAFIAASDICILPAYPNEETMQHIVPIKVYEYMAMGKAVVSTRLPGVMAEFGTDNGVVYVDRVEDVVTEAMGLFNSGSLTDLGAKARKFAERNTWDTIADEFERILEEAIKEKKRETAPEQV